ncbi:hypothetical protein, partial [Aeromonas veronii]|uniref:hypothetical protein n=1 Tax=Aeromonas veronii TaxID=654 RepID=UPI002246FAD7
DDTSGQFLLFFSVLALIWCVKTTAGSKGGLTGHSFPLSLDGVCCLFQPVIYQPVHYVAHLHR